MKVYIRSIILAFCLSSSFSAPWGTGLSNDPMGRGFLTGRGPSSPPLYNAGPGNLAPAFSFTQQPSGFSQFNSGLNQQVSSADNVLLTNARQVVAG